MKSVKIFLTLSFIIYPLAFSSAGLPQPTCVFYGQALDEYGWPYMDNADVELRVGTNVYARYSINGSLAPGVNFALHVHIDDAGADDKYDPYTLHTGDEFDIVVVDGQGEQPILEEESMPPIGKPGEVAMINITAGEDSDGDGLPDKWEWELINSGINPAITSLVQVVGSDDYDGDGQSNQDEYIAGTFAFLDYDYLFAERLAMTATDRIEIEFLSVPGKIYSIYGNTNLMSGTWSLVPQASSATGPLQTTPAIGTGDWLSIFIPLEGEKRMLRISVE